MRSDCPAAAAAWRLRHLLRARAVPELLHPERDGAARDDDERRALARRRWRPRVASKTARRRRACASRSSRRRAARARRRRAGRVGPEVNHAAVGVSMVVERARRARATSRRPGDAGGRAASRGPLDERRRRVALVVDDRGLRASAGRDHGRARAASAPSIAATDAARLLHVDAHGALGARELEVAVEQVPEEERRSALRTGQTSATGPKPRQRRAARSRAPTKRSGLREEPARPVGPRRLGEDVARFAA